MRDLFVRAVDKPFEDKRVTCNTEQVTTPSIVENIIEDITSEELEVLKLNENYTNNQEEYIARKQKTLQLIDEMKTIQTRIQTVTTEAESRASSFDRKVQVTDTPTLKSIRKVFGKKLSYIDKEMYLEAKRQMLALQKENIKDFN